MINSLLPNLELTSPLKLTIHHSSWDWKCGKHSPT